MCVSFDQWNDIHMPTLCICYISHTHALIHDIRLCIVRLFADTHHIHVCAPTFGRWSYAWCLCCMHAFTVKTGIPFADVVRIFVYSLPFDHWLTHGRGVWEKGACMNVMSVGRQRKLSVVVKSWTLNVDGKHVRESMYESSAWLFMVDAEDERLMHEEMNVERRVSGCVPTHGCVREYLDVFPLQGACLSLTISFIHTYATKHLDLHSGRIHM